MILDSKYGTYIYTVYNHIEETHKTKCLVFEDIYVIVLGNMTLKKKQKRYVVWKGKKQGIYTTRDACKVQVQ